MKTVLIVLCLVALAGCMKPEAQSCRANTCAEVELPGKLV